MKKYLVLVILTLSVTTLARDNHVNRIAWTDTPGAFPFLGADAQGYIHLMDLNLNSGKDDYPLLDCPRVKAGPLKCTMWRHSDVKVEFSQDPRRIKQDGETFHVHIEGTAFYAKDADYTYGPRNTQPITNNVSAPEIVRTQ